MERSTWESIRSLLFYRCRFWATLARTASGGRVPVSCPITVFATILCSTRNRSCPPKQSHRCSSRELVLGLRQDQSRSNNMNLHSWSCSMWKIALAGESPCLVKAVVVDRLLDWELVVEGAVLQCGTRFFECLRL